MGKATKETLKKILSNLDQIMTHLKISPKSEKEKQTTKKIPVKKQPVKSRSKK